MAVTGGSGSATPATFTVVFSESVTGVASGAFTAAGSGVTTGAVTVTGSGTTYAVSVAFTGGPTGSVALSLNSTANTTVKDASNNFYAGNATAGGSNTATFTVTTVADTTAPTLALVGGSGSTSPALFTANLSEAVTGVGAPAFTATGSSVTTGTITLTGSGTSYTVSVPFTGASGSIALGLNSSATTTIKDASNNFYAGGATAGGSTTATFTVTSAGGAPVVSAASVSGQVGSAIAPVTVFATNSPTSYSASGLSTYGLSINASGQITGVPTQTASNVPVAVTATNSSGSGNGTITLNISAAPNPGGGGGGGGGGTTLTQTIAFTSSSSGTVGSPITLMANSSAGLIPVTFSLSSGNALLANGVLTPQAAGAIVVRASQAGGGSYLPASAEQVILVKAAQTITFTAPAGVTIGQAATLSATSSAGLPITFSLVSGDATLSGATLTPRAPGIIVVRAAQAGSDTVGAAAAEVVITPAKASQSITFAVLNNTLGNAGPIALTASASSGLPVAFSVSGPASVSGGTLTLTGAPGTVAVRANQAGNATYHPAAEVVRTFVVGAIGQQVFLGNIGADTFAIVISADGREGMFITRIAASGEAIVVRFTVNADGTFNATSTSLASGEVIADASTPATAAAGQTRTLGGRVQNGVVTGTIAELGASFSANAVAPVGPTAALAGVYTATVPGSSGGQTYIVAGPNGQAFAVAITPNGVISGTGTITADGAISIATSGDGSILGNVNATTGVVSGSVTHAGTSSAFVGLAENTAPTDRLINLSSRLRFVANDSSRSVIAGFYISGTEAKRVLVRAVGPGLTGFGVTGVLANPKLQIFASGGAVVSENEDWSNNADLTATGDSVGAFRLASGSLDAAVVATLVPGAYTAVVTGGTGSGVVLVEVYDATSNQPVTAQQLVNISTRGFVDTGDGNLIAGFAISGNTPKRVLIRGIGPSLAQFNVSGSVADPTLRLFAQGSAAVIAQNNDWSLPQPVNAAQSVASSAELAAAFAATGAFPLAAGSRDAAILITLMPGAYSAVVSGANNTTGAGLVEVYEVPTP